jgi:predicted PurR-regulated permease PerM
VRVLERLRSVTRATIKGTVVIGVIQGTLAGIGLWFAGLPSAAFWGTIMAVLSIVPGIGAALVWLPAVIYLFVTGQKLAATLLLIWCSAVVGTIDNCYAKTRRKDAKMPDLLILIGTLGGLFLFGPVGFIIGPLVCGLFLTVWEIYGATFKDVLPPVGDLATGEIKKPEAKLPASKESESKSLEPMD